MTVLLTGLLLLIGGYLQGTIQSEFEREPAAVLGVDG